MLNRYKDPGIIEAEILMMRQVHRGSFLLVEGDDDSKFWRARVSEQECEIILANGKPNLVGAIDKLDKCNFIGALGVVDDDFDSLEASRPQSVNIVATDTHDIECLLLRSPALTRVLAELGNRQKLKQFEINLGKTVREGLLERGLSFGRLRWLAVRFRWGLDFNKLTPERFLDRNRWLVKEQDICNEVCQRIQWNDAALQTALGALPVADPWQICQGHDLISILTLGLRQILGEIKNSIGAGHIAALLRTAFHAEDLAGTKLYGEIRAWEQRNMPYRILTEIPRSEAH